MQLHNPKDQTPIATSAAEMDEQTIAVFTGCGSRYANNKLERLAIATDFARALGADPTFAQYEAARIAFVDGYCRANPDNTGNAADQEFSRFAAMLKDLFGLEKPKSTSAAAEKKAAERKAATEKLLADNAHKDIQQVSAELELAYQRLAKNPTDPKAKKAAAGLTKVLKAKQSEENREHGEQLKALRAQVIEAARKCTDLDILDAALATFEAAEINEE